jgi:hypothetical protein
MHGRKADAGTKIQQPGHQPGIYRSEEELGERGTGTE